jgi:ATP-binding cassette subfamily A (ABC1) protein 3
VFNQAYADHILKVCSGEPKRTLQSVNAPLPLTTAQTVEIKAILSILASLFLLIPYCYIPGAFIVFMVQEKSCKSKHLQLVSGVDVRSYWISNYAFDASVFLLLTLLVMAVFMFYGSDSAEVFVGDLESFFCTMALTFGYGLSILPFAYLCSRRFNNHSSAQIAVIGIGFVTGFVFVMAYFIMISIESTEELAKTLRPIFRIFPGYNVGDGFIQMANAFWERRIQGTDSGRPFSWEVAGKPVLLLYGLAPIYFLILLILEYSGDGSAGGKIGWVIRSAKSSWERLILRCNGVHADCSLDDGLKEGTRDEDVEGERIFVYENIDQLKHSAPIVYQDLWKIYPPSVGLFGTMAAFVRGHIYMICCLLRKSSAERRTVILKERRRVLLPKRAVRGVTTCIQEGETFALLGANGAGKSTSLNAITGDISATKGKVFVAGYCVTGSNDDYDVTNARKHLGYCPQIDPLLELMTPRETLAMFGQIRGIPLEILNGHVEKLLEFLLLSTHAEKTCENLSGGNKRKLSLGIALIGDPTVLLIDESSSGLDPVAKRRMWSLISRAAKNRSIILTTHQMEEAEALCTRAGIMGNGELLCLGSVQHLKSKYLDGYTIDMFCGSTSSETDRDALVSELLENSLPGSLLAERHGRFLRFDVPTLPSLGLGYTFRRLQALKGSCSFPLENYSISQCSLEQVFIKLTKQNNFVD